ncbi:recombinase family protein [Lacticaseibacillus brantae]|uniref:Resolvase/invertase-type recombinase catalytic domain-containing protein n=1 Tax=Lacticaseibacillus brantae DSM 23927 TaxID=1423727 RepID=A0A0R2AY94_9LACO|nr:recombinase family protein [Lacticaseibacillus brantae]KRM71984.1 hypothetical protein FC34_GL000966 [Lacticaseibacillus brantae DSM 23927]
MRFGYAWASTTNKRFLNQIDQLQGAEPDHLLTELGSQEMKKRPVLLGLLKRIQPGDQLIVTSFDRLSRDPEVVVQLLIELSLKGIRLVLLDIVSIHQANTWTADFLVQKLLVPLKEKAVATYAKSLRHRQAVGIETAKNRGVYQGRPILYGPDVKNPERRQTYLEIRSLLKRGDSIYHIQQVTGHSNSLIRRIKMEMVPQDGEGSKQ